MVWTKKHGKVLSTAVDHHRDNLEYGPVREISRGNLLRAAKLPGRPRRSGRASAR